jgi:site-specific recombinase XerD
MSKLKRDPPYLTQEEVRRLLSVARHHSRNPERDYLLLTLMYNHGFRVSELVGRLRVQDVDLVAKKLHVTRAKGSQGGSHDLVNDEAKLIKAWLELRPQTECDTLFVSERKRPLNRKAVWAMIQKFADAAGFDFPVYPHMLRHATGYALVNNGADIRKIQDYLGHVSITSTQRYTNLDSRRFEGFGKMLRL